MGFLYIPHFFVLESKYGVFLTWLMGDIVVVVDVVVVVVVVVVSRAGAGAGGFPEEIPSVQVLY